MRIERIEFIQLKLRGMVVPWRVSRVSGPDVLAIAPDDVVAVCLVRNGMAWIEVFLDHHRKLGVRHFVFLDNNSSDGTAQRLTQETDVTVLTSNLHYRAYENAMKRYVVNRFCAGHWCLFVDIDELFDYPFSQSVSLPALIGYLEQAGANAMIQQMVDHFADAPLAAGHQPGDFRTTHRFIDTESVYPTDYHDSPDGPVRMHNGGVRLRAFGTNNGLTKVSLFKLDGTLEPFVDWHHVRGGCFADVSGALLHYPFVGDFVDRVSDAVRKGLYSLVPHHEYTSYLAGLSAGTVNLAEGPCRPFPGVDALADEGFLYAGPAFRRFAGENTLRQQA